MSTAKIPVDLILSRLAADTEKAQARAQKASHVLLEDLDTSIASTPCEVVYTEDRMKVKHYLPTRPLTYNHPLLITYALINRETMLDLQPGRSVVRNLLDAGIELYLIEWGYPTRKDRFLTIDDHVNGYLDNVVDFIRERHGLPKIHLMGVCMGGTFSLIYAALHPEKVKNLVTTVTPSNFDTDQGLLHVWMKAVDVDSLVDAFGNMSGDLLNALFLMMNPARLMIDKYVGFMENMDDKTFVENFVRMEKWIFDSPDVPGETFRQFIKDCYQRNLLIQSRLMVGDRRVDLANVRMPLLNIYAKYDHLVPPEACERLTGAVGSTDTEDLCLDTGHIGIYVSGKCQREFSPRIAAWLKERDDPDPSPAPKQAGRKRSARKRASEAAPASSAPAGE